MLKINKYIMSTLNDVIVIKLKHWIESNTNYDTNDYIHDFNDFLKIKNKNNEKK